MTFAERMHSALRAPQPAESLHDLIVELGREGRGKPEILMMIEGFLEQQRPQPEFRDEDMDVVSDVLDALHGWCHPAAELLPKRPV